jgi:uncharacterized membrane protein YdjX (TVP38/TMEM64 family)
MRDQTRTTSLEPQRFSYSVGMRWAATAVALLAVWAGYQWVPAIQYFVDRTTSLLMMGDFHALKMFILSFGWWAPAVSAGLMIFQTLAAPLPAFVLAIANAMAFGVFYGFLLSVGSALLAAFLAFYLARWLGRPFVARWVRGMSADSLVERYGAWGILLLRLFPIVSFDFVSFAAGLTVLRPLPFGLATLLGMMPAALAFSMLGDSIESANRWTFIGGVLLFVILIVFSLIMRRSKVMKR